MAAQEQFVIDAKGRKKGGLLSVEQYEKLMEDLHDLAIVAERPFPSQTVKLEGAKNLFRIRVGDYRLVSGALIWSAPTCRRFGRCDLSQQVSEHGP